MKQLELQRLAESRRNCVLYSLGHQERFMRARPYPLTVSGCRNANLFGSLPFEKRVLKPRELVGHSVWAWSPREGFSQV